MHMARCQSSTCQNEYAMNHVMARIALIWNVAWHFQTACAETEMLTDRISIGDPGHRSNPTTKAASMSAYVAARDEMAFQTTGWTISSKWTLSSMAIWPTTMHLVAKLLGFLAPP
jgi:hypothetical protein